jgi:hypothetical protein
MIPNNMREKKARKINPTSFFPNQKKKQQIHEGGMLLRRGD